MTERLIGETGSKKRRRFRLLPIALVACIALFVVAGAQAVHDEKFQLDGDAFANIGDVGGSQTVDWDSLINTDGSLKTRPADFTASGFDKDFVNSGATFVTSDTSTFATGSKDTLPISGWQCNFDNNVNSKIDVMNAYAATYVDPDNDHEIIYFGMERNTNTGDANVGFWFLQSDVGCETAGAATTFSGAHADGDLLIVSAFSGGGTVSTIDVYRWNGGANGSLGTTPLAHGVDCRSATTPTNDTACATANTADITTPWLTSNFKDKVGNKLRAAEFFEGGVDLTAANLGGKCFNTFIGDTRSSTSLTATLFDYSRGVLGVCASGVVTTPSVGSDGAVSIGAGSVNVTDTAVLTVGGSDTYGGTMTFHLCGPTPLTDANYTLCASGGTLVGAAKPVSGPSPSTVVSDAATITSAGRYCWRGDYSGDAGVGVPPSSDSAVTECFRVIPVTPTLTTSATASVNLGSPISDTATLGGTATQPNGSAAGGTITFRLYKDDATCAAASLVFTSAAIAVSGNGDYNSGNFTPTAAGTYRWIASYSGNAPNTNPIAGACGDAGETTIVISLQPSMTTAQRFVPNDSVTVTVAAGANDLAGNVRFQLYVNDSDCSEAAAYDSGNIAISSGTGTGLSRTVSSANTTAYATTGTTFSWKVTYTSTNAGHTNVTATCNAENSSITIDNGGTFNTP